MEKALSNLDPLLSGEKASAVLLAFIPDELVRYRDSWLQSPKDYGSGRQDTFGSDLVATAVIKTCIAPAVDCVAASVFVSHFLYSIPSAKLESIRTGIFN